MGVFDSRRVWLLVILSFRVCHPVAVVVVVDVFGITIVFDGFGCRRCCCYRLCWSIFFVAVDG